MVDYQGARAGFSESAKAYVKRLVRCKGARDIQADGLVRIEEHGVPET